MAETKTETPEGAAFTLVIPMDRAKKEVATFHIKEMTEDVFLAAKSMIDKGKHFDAVRMIVKELHVGGDPLDKIKGNFIATRSLLDLVMEFVDPVEGELKKN